MGGDGLAAPATATGTAALAALQQAAQAISGTPSGDAVWVGAAYSPPADASAAAVDSGWSWFTHPVRNEFNELLLSAEVNSRPVAAGEARWGSGFPKLFGARFVGIEEQTSLESCAVLRWPRGGDGSVWENYACSSRVARFFVRPSAGLTVLAYGKSSFRLRLQCAKPGVHACLTCYAYVPCVFCVPVLFWRACLAVRVWRALVGWR